MPLFMDTHSLDGVDTVGLLRPQARFKTRMEW